MLLPFDCIRLLTRRPPDPAPQELLSQHDGYKRSSARLQRQLDQLRDNAARDGKASGQKLAASEAALREALERQAKLGRVVTLTEGKAAKLKRKLTAAEEQVRALHCP